MGKKGVAETDYPTPPSVSPSPQTQLGGIRAILFACRSHSSIWITDGGVGQPAAGCPTQPTFKSDQITVTNLVIESNQPLKSFVVKKFDYYVSSEHLSGA